MNPMFVRFLKAILGIALLFISFAMFAAAVYLFHRGSQEAPGEARPALETPAGPGATVK